MQIIILFAGCLVFQALAEVSTHLKSDNHEESSIGNHLEEADKREEKFSYLLSLLKSAITAEENNTNIKTINRTDIVVRTENDLQQTPKDLEIFDVKMENDTDIFGKTFDKIISKISIAIDHPQNNISERKPKDDIEILDKDNKTDIFGKTSDKMVTNISTSTDKLKNMNQNIEIPTMIPIFKTKPKIESKKPSESNKFVPRQSAKTFEPLNYADLNFKNKPLQFNIPCQRAADILEMNPPVRSTKIQTNGRNLNPIARITDSKIQNQGPKPVTISVNLKDLDESVRMEFKPKAISLMQLYGNILRKLTITVLVPYHINISKLKPFN